MVTYGKGGWTWNDLYHNIPVYLRNFYLAEMVKAVDRERESVERSTKTSRAVKREDGKVTIEPPVKLLSRKQ